MLFRSGSDADGKFQLWHETAPLARFDSVALPRLSAESKPAGIWFALHAKQVQVMQDGVWPGVFALRVTLRLPSSYAAPVSLLKPLLDGVTAAFGVYEGSQLALVSERLAAQLGLGAARVADLLTKRSQALLGSCQLVVPRAMGVQWQPADDRCVACELRVERTGASAATLDGELLAVT